MEKVRDSKNDTDTDPHPERELNHQRSPRTDSHRSRDRNWHEKRGANPKTDADTDPRRRMKSITLDHGADQIAFARGDGIDIGDLIAAMGERT